MKYMGSKRAMLTNGLGALLNEKALAAERFVDLFAGSAIVSTHVASLHSVPVHAFDLQQYSVVLASAVLERENQIEWQELWNEWLEHASTLRARKRVPKQVEVCRSSVLSVREWCSAQASLTVTRAYGGHYFSSRQAVWIDCFRSSLPNSGLLRTVALAALIDAASQCAAAPGHTAQPFQPTRTAKQFLQEAWERDVVERVRLALKDVSERSARVKGTAAKLDANRAAHSVCEHDLVFVDPPYSGVHYSRFYHVLETIARGVCGDVSGTGRYPAPELRPRSEYSMKKTSRTAIDRLLETLASRRARVVLTFPDHNCSNGLSGDIVRTISEKYFWVEERSVKSRFSTMGGPKDQSGHGSPRGARKSAKELILSLEPR